MRTIRGVRSPSFRAFFGWTFFALTGCAALMNSGRPAYTGPVKETLWHVSGFAVTEAPVVAGNVVYAVGHPFDSGYPTIYAFDLETGKTLWAHHDRDDHIVAVAGRAIFVGVANGAFSHALDAGTGRELPYQLTSAPHVAYADGTLYVAGTTLRAATLDGHVLWERSLPVRAIANPVIAGNVVMVRGFSHVDELTPDTNAALAFDRKTGELLWHTEMRDRFKAPARRFEFTGLIADDRTAYLLESIENEQSFVVGDLLTAIDVRTGKPRWTHANLGPCPDGPSFPDATDILVCEGPRAADGAGSRYRALSRANGAKRWEGATKWDYDNATAAGRYAVASDHRVHAVLNENNQTSADSWLTLVDRRTGDEVWRSQVSELAVFTAPAIGHDVAVVGSAPFTHDGDPQNDGDKSVGGIWAWRFDEAHPESAGLSVTVLPSGSP